jgi:hypothetical protein
VTSDVLPASLPGGGLTIPSIFGLLAGGWRSLEESMPAACDRTNAADSTGMGIYAVRHNPAAYYLELRSTTTGGDGSCIRQDVTYDASTSPDVSARFTLVTPNLVDDMHKTPATPTQNDQLAAGDTWLSTFLPQVFSTPDYVNGRTAVFVVWDEGTTGDARVPLIVATPFVPPDATVAGSFTHFDLLRTFEDLLGLQPYLGQAASATGLRSPFNL